MEIAIAIYFVIGFFSAFRRTFNPIPSLRPVWALNGTPEQKLFGFSFLMILWPLVMIFA